MHFATLKVIIDEQLKLSRTTFSISHWSGQYLGLLVTGVLRSSARSAHG